MSVNARGLGKLLVLVNDQANARRHAALLRGWMPPAQAATVQLATSVERNAHETLERWRASA